MEYLLNSFSDFISGMGIFSMTWQMYVMWGVVAVLLFFGVVKQFEPLLLVPIAFGALIANIPDNGMVITQAQRQVVSIKDGQVQTETINDVGFISADVAPYADSAPAMQDTSSLSPEDKAKYEAAMAEKMVVSPLVDENGVEKKGMVKVSGQTSQKVMIIGFHSGLFDFLGQGIKCEIFPALIFMGVGALTDFGPLLASPKALLLGAAAQGGVAFTFLAAMAMGFTKGEASAIGIIGGADGPTSIFLASTLAGRHRRGGILLHGACAAHPATVHETLHHRSPAQDQDEEPAPGFQGREAVLLLRGDDYHHPHLPGCSTAAGYAHVR